LAEVDEFAVGGLVVQLVVEEVDHVPLEARELQGKALARDLVDADPVETLASFDLAALVSEYLGVVEEEIDLVRNPEELVEHLELCARGFALIPLREVVLPGDGLPANVHGELLRLGGREYLDRNTLDLHLACVPGRPQLSGVRTKRQVPVARGVLAVGLVLDDVVLQAGADEDVGVWGYADNPRGAKVLFDERPLALAVLRLNLLILKLDLTGQLEPRPDQNDQPQIGLLVATGRSIEGPEDVVDLLDNLVTPREAGFRLRIEQTLEQEPLDIVQPRRADALYGLVVIIGLHSLSSHWRG
jgi:hypothetical protein